MKRTLLLSVLSAALLFSTNTNAQIPGVSKVTKALPEVDLGIKVGANFQQITGEFWDNGYKAGFEGGVFVGIRKNKLGVQGEVLINSVKYSVSDAVASAFGPASVKALYLDVPVMVEYKIVPRLWIQLGPQFTEMVSAKNQDGEDAKDAFNTTGFSGVLGLQAQLPLHFTAGARYVLGFTDVAKSTTTATVNESWKNRSIQVYLGFRFL
jgi:hypothetical protein